MSESKINPLEQRVSTTTARRARAPCDSQDLLLPSVRTAPRSTPSPFDCAVPAVVPAPAPAAGRFVFVHSLSSSSSSSRLVARVYGTKTFIFDRFCTYTHRTPPCEPLGPRPIPLCPTHVGHDKGPQGISRWAGCAWGWPHGGVQGVVGGAGGVAARRRGGTLWWGVMFYVSL